MRNIYSTAAKVIIWLGPWTNAADSLLMGVDDLGHSLIAMGFWNLVLQKQNDLVAWLSISNESPDMDGTRGFSGLMESHLHIWSLTKVCRESGVSKSAQTHALRVSSVGYSQSISLSKNVKNY